MSDSLWPHGLQHAVNVPLSFNISPNLLKFMFTESVMLSNLLILCHPFSFCLQSFPASGSFPVNWHFASGGQSIGASASASSGLISFRIDFWTSCSSRDSQEFSPAPQFESISSLVFRLLYGPAFTSTHDYWKYHIFDYTFVGKVMSLFFNTLSRFVLAFLLRSKHLHGCSQSAVILKPKKIKSVTVSM